ncbi:Ribose/Galactose isomerase-domain-containing protein [Rhizophagus diaphanus]|nr:Ribose/Galactose isomerase-domain-containing protein [Rhizophagus diaphanus] [Rhizophagus sp. MUCL 43196]
MKKNIKIYLGSDPHGKELKDVVKNHLTSLLTNDQFSNLEIVDLGTQDKYYDIAFELASLVGERKNLENSEEKKGILVCGTGMGMSIIANKVPGVYASPCQDVKTAFDSRGINNSNVLTLGSIVTNNDNAKEIIETWLKTSFTSGWEDKQDVKDFLENSMKEIPKLISNHSHIPYSTQALSGDTNNEASFVPIPGLDERCKWCLLRQERHVNTSDSNDDSIERLRAVVRFPKGSMEPPHHHTHGHDVFVIRGHKTVKNLTTGVDYDLRPGGYLYTPATQIHQVFYHEDTEYWFGSDEGFDMMWDTDVKNVVFEEDQ